MEVRLTVKTYLAVFLLVLGGIHVYLSQNYGLLAQLIAAPIITSALDIAINYVKTRKIIMPDSAVVSGLFIGSILPLSDLLVLAAACVLAIASKHIIRFNGKHIFNPAGFGILVSGLAFSFIPIWWSSATLLIIPFGLFIIYKQRKWFLALSFIIAYYAMLALANLADVSSVLTLEYTALFFAFFMLVEPLTSTYKKKAMIAQGALAAILAYAFGFVAGMDVFLAALLVTNILVPFLNQKLR